MTHFLLTLALFACLLSADTSAIAAPNPEFFDMPSGISTEAGLAIQPDGDVWFPANVIFHTPGIGRLVPGEGTPGTANGMSVFPTPRPAVAEGEYPCCANAVRSVADDAAHNRVWFVQNEGVVGYVETEKVVPATSTGMNAKRVEENEIWDVAFSPSTNLAWFTEHGYSNRPPYPGERIASIDENLNVHELPNLAIQNGGAPVEPEFTFRYDPEPSGITIDPNGKPWFAEESGDSGWRIGTAPSGGEKGPYTEYELESCPSLDGCIAPTDTAVAPDGSVWYTTTNNEVGRLNATQTEFENFSMTSIDPGFSEGKPERITAAPDGTIWVSENGFYGHSGANALVRIVPSAVPTTTVYPLGSNAPYALAADTKGNVWFSATAEIGDSGEIGRLAGVVGTSSEDGEEKAKKEEKTREEERVAQEEKASKEKAESVKAEEEAKMERAENENAEKEKAKGLSGPAPSVNITTPTTSPTEKVLTPVSRGTAKISPPIPKGNSVTAEQICIGPPSNPCAVVYLLSAGEYVTGFPGTKASVAKAEKKKKTNAVILGRTAVTLQGGQKRKVTVTLNAKGRKLLKSKGKLTVFFTATQEGSNGTPPKLLEHIKVTFHSKRH